MIITAEQLNQWRQLKDAELKAIFQNVSVDDFPLNDENDRLVKLFWTTKCHQIFPVLSQRQDSRPWKQKYTIYLTMTYHELTDEQKKLFIMAKEGRSVDDIVAYVLSLKKENIQEFISSKIFEYCDAEGDACNSVIKKIIYQSIFELAIAYSNVSLLRDDLLAVVDIQKPNKEGKFAVDVAFEKNNHAITGLLIYKRGAQLSCAKGSTRLIDAVKSKDINLVNALIKAGVNVNGVDDEYKTALDYAYDVEHSEIFAILFNKGARFAGQENQSGFDLLLEAVKNKESRLVKLLLAARAYGDYVFDDHRYDNSPFKCAVDNDNYGAFKILYDALPKAPESRFLLYALRHQNIRLAEFLLRAGIDVNLENDANLNALHYAMAHNNEGIVKILLEKKVNLNGIVDGKRTINDRVFVKGQAMLDCAVVCNNAIVAEKIGKDERGVTALQLAIKAKNEAMALSLLEKNCIIDDDFGCADNTIRTTELHLALQYGLMKVATEILKKKPYLVDVKNTIGSPLENARKSKHVLLPLMELLSYQQKVNRRARDDYKLSSFCGFFGLFGINYSAGQKQDAAKALVDVVLFGKDKKGLESCRGALNNGELKGIVKKINKLRS